MSAAVNAAQHATVSKIAQVFPKAVANHELVSTVAQKLKSYGYGEGTLVCSSLCCDEIARPLENDFAKVYNGHYFSLGGLAGFPFGGMTGFGAMAAHIPVCGNCLMVYGPHVGVSSEGVVGTVERRGLHHGGACCGSAVAARGYVAEAMKGKAPEITPGTDILDPQQSYVATLLMPHGEKLDKAEDPMVTLPYSLFEIQNDLVTKIVTNSASKLGKDGMIALLGGVQINTPPDMSDYFMPMRFDLMNERGEIVESLLD